MSTAAATLSESNGFEFHPSLTEDERRFYTKAYPSVDLVRERKVHCTVCKMHIGTAPSQEDNIKMHPILRVTHCIKCHDFYNSGEFSKGEDGSELYCRWCGQGGEVYCCSNCPYVFCKSCIVKNLSRGVVADIEQNENWSCFSCAPKILWPLRAQHWALVNYIEKQKQSIQSMNFTEDDLKQEMNKDRSNCCRLAKSKCGNMSDSLESLDSTASRRSFGSNSTKKPIKVPYHPMQSPPAKRAKTSNDEVVCTPDLMSMLEPDCQITIPNKSRAGPPIAVSTPKVISIQPNFGTIPTPAAHKSTVPPPLVLRNTGIQMRPIQTSPIVRRTVVGPRPPTPGGGHTPVYHTINGFRIDLNSAAQQETFRLPNGKLIQVKRQGTQQNIGTPNNSWQQRNVPNPQPQSIRPLQISHSAPPSNFHTVTLQQPAANGQALPHPHQQIVRYQNTVLGSTTVTPINHNGTQIQLINGTPTAPVQQTPQSFRPLMVRHIFPDTAIGQARSQLQDQVFCAMDICQHLTGKVQTLTNSNAYKQARNYLEVKELYIHLSYLLTYAIGRFKGLQDKCLADMRQLGFVNDADSLENGQLAAGVDYVQYGQLDDVDLFNTGSNSFHNQVYEYRKNLHSNADDKEGIKDSLTAPKYNDTNEDIQSKDWPTDVFTGDNTGDNNEILDEYMDVCPDEVESKPVSEANSEIGTNNVEGYTSREVKSHAYDRKLTRLIEQYPSIWCTRHPDYGNFDVTRKQWRTIASYFRRGDNIKLRWKNIRKRFVRIERRVREGKRFNGYFDKATNYLANRDLSMDDWIEVDRGDDNSEEYEQLQIGKATHSSTHSTKKSMQLNNNKKSIKPIDIQPNDIKIINFVKSNPVLWRCCKTNDTSSNAVDEQTRKSLWMHLWKSMSNINCEDIIDRWTYLYEMYKTFRLKSIKSERTLAKLELKYSKYLAKLYFLYKIEEDDLKSDTFKLDDIDPISKLPHNETRIQDMADDEDFVVQLVRLVRQYPVLWHTQHSDYHNTALRNHVWREIESKLRSYRRDLLSIKLRWQLVKFSYFRLRRDSLNAANSLPSCAKTVPANEMTFLDI